MVATLESNEVRGRWSELVAATASGETDVVITQQGEPVLAIIDYVDYLAIVEALEDARLARRADAVMEDLEAGRTTARPWEEIRAEWIAEGLLDECTTALAGTVRPPQKSKPRSPHLAVHCCFSIMFALMWN